MARTRRGRGDGTLFKRADGYWVGGVELAPGADGRRRYKRIVRRDRNDAMAALRRLKADVAAGTITTAKSVTLARWLHHWHAEILPHRNVRPATAVSYLGTIDRDITPHIGAIRLDKLHPRDIRQLYTTLTDAKSARAAQKADQVLRLALSAAVRDGLIGSSIMDRVDKPAHTPRENTALSAATVLTIIGAAIETQGPIWAARWAVGFATGARESEVLGLEWDRVDLDRGLVDISWQLHRVPKAHGCGAPDGKAYPCGRVRPSFCPQSRWHIPAAMEWRECAGTLVWTRPKTRAGRRVVPLIPAVVDILRALPDDGPNPHGLVFRHADGRPISTEDDQRAWKALLIAADVPHAPQHSIRHSTATLLLESGVDAHIVQSVIGHSDIAMTRHYQHVNNELAARAWSKLAALMPTITDV